MLNLEGRELGGCKLIRKIGEGGMGEVYLAEQIRVGNRQVAIKVVRPADLTASGGVRGDVERRFKREAALLGQFSHPNILPIYDSGVEDGYLYIVMPYAQEGSLSDAIRGRFGRRLELPLELPAAADLIGQVAAALQYTHDHDVVHRDVKPGNILIRIEPDGHWRMLLADFGVARGPETTTQQTLVTGTFAYMAPEQFSGKFSPASDQYALGVVAYQLLAGRPPFEGEIGELTRAHLYEQPPSLRALNPAVPPAVEAVILRALAKDPAQRYPSVRQFADAFRAAASGAETNEATQDLQPPPLPEVPALLPPDVAPGAQPVAPWSNGTPPQRGRTNSSARLLVVTVVAALLLACVAGIAAISLRGPQPSITPTATSNSSTPGQITPITGGQATAVVQATQTAQAASNVPTATAAAGVDTDMGSAPPAPAGVGALTFSEALPACDTVYANSWQPDAQTKVDCSADGAKITAQASDALACVEYKRVTPDAYISALATQGSGDVTLGFRVNHAQGTATTQQVTGYYFRVTPTTRAYVLFSIDAAGKGNVIGGGVIPATLAQHFAIGARYNGTSITLYINGVQIGEPVTDTTYTTGGMALCSTGVTTYRAWQVYAAS
jgi:serine/threonine protein kinase